MIMAAEKDAAESTEVLKRLLIRSFDAFCGLEDPLGIDEDVLSNRIAYASPDRVSQSYDGAEAEVGFRIPRDWNHPWLMYFYLWVGDGAECQFIAQVDFKQPDLPIEKLRGAAEDLGTEEYGFEVQGKEAWISEVIPLVGPFQPGCDC